MKRSATWGVIVLAACAPPAAVVTPDAMAPRPDEPKSVTNGTPPPPEWSEVTRSPWPVELAPRERAMTSACGEADAALARVAADLVAERARGLGPPDPDRVVGRLRARGVPHVRPRIVSVTSHGPNDDARVAPQLAATKQPGSRCGVAFGRSGGAETKDGDELMVAVVVEALADLDPMPTRGRTGEWLTFTATLHTPATNAKLVILGSRGLPRTVPTSIDRSTGKVRARFALDRPGGFTVQLMADLDEGPRPLLEARVFADVAPSSAMDDSPAPGESVPATGDDAATLARMTETLRTEESMPALRRDERLDTLARAHAEEMRASRAVAHDLGEGDLIVRFETAGLAAKSIGENVARARSLALAHRALYASPSHRMNLLRADYTHAGFGVVTDDAGTVYVCEVFAGGLR